MACTGLTSIEPLANWNTTNLRDTYEMFIDCSNIESLDGLENWDMSNIVTAGHMFTRCSKLTDISAVEKWNLESAIDVTKMFKQCVSLTDIRPIASWKLNTDNLYEMFYNYIYFLMNISFMYDKDIIRIHINQTDIIYLCIYKIY